MSVKNKIYNNFVNKFLFGEWNPVIDGIPTPESYYQTYVFKQLAKIQANDAQQDDYFGWSVAVSDTRIVVGARGEDSIPNNGAGSAYIFDINGNQIAKIRASDAYDFDWFGWSVAVSNTRIVVGAGKFIAADGAGAAYIFDIDGNQLAKIQASDAEDHDQFSYSVAVSDTRIVVGAYAKYTTAPDAGAAYIFDIDGNQLAKIQASDAEAGDRFGYSVAVSDTHIVVGADSEDTTANNAGSAYIFDIDGNQLAKIQASDAEAGDQFGEKVAVSDTRIVVGARYEDTTATNAGAVYIFDIDGNQLAKKQASDAEDSDNFGYSVAVSDTHIVVGAPYEDTTASNAGSAYIFQNDLVYKSDYSNNINNINFNKLKYRFTGKL